MSTPEPIPPLPAPSPLTLDEILAAMDAHAKAQESKTWAWIKTNWHNVVGHVVTWSALFGPWLLKHL
jgi:hypothetical protein